MTEKKHLVVWKTLSYGILSVFFANVIPGCQPCDNMKVGDFLKDFPKEERLSPFDSISLNHYGITLPDGFGKYREWFIVKIIIFVRHCLAFNPV